MSCSTSSSAPSWTTDQPGPGCGFRSASSPPNAPFRSTSRRLAALDQWANRRGGHRPIPHPRTGKPTDFLFTEHGRRLGATRLRNGLLAAVAQPGYRPGGQPLTVTPHQLRHTYATALANAGMSLQALMALLGHVTPEMTIRYATLASPTLRGAYDEAMGKMRRQLTLTPVGRPIVPDKVSWLASEMLKTRVAHGYCSRHESQGPCPYANICETCDNYTPAAEFEPALTDQLADVRALQADAEQRGWTGEEERHRHVAAALENHLDSIRPGDRPTTCLTRPRGPDKREVEPRDPPPHRRRRDLPRPQLRDPAHRRRPGRATRRMDRRPPLPLRVLHGPDIHNIQPNRRWPHPNS